MFISTISGYLIIYYFIIIHRSRPGILSEDSCHIDICITKDRPLFFQKTNTIFYYLYWYYKKEIVLNPSQPINKSIKQSNTLYINIRVI